MLALLHTSPVHVPAFDALRDADHPGVALRHLVHEELLARARAEGPGAVAEAVGDVLARAVADGATAVLCTCSTIGDIAERAAPALGVPVLRVDRPMARAAAAAGRVVVVATVESTLGPTADLVRDEVARQRREPGPVLSTVLVEGAWERFEAGDLDGYLDAVAAAVDLITAPAVVVLAQASMAAVAERVTSGVTVLAAPRPGLAAAVLAPSATRGIRRAGARAPGDIGNARLPCAVRARTGPNPVPLEERGMTGTFPDPVPPSPTPPPGPGPGPSPVPSPPGPAPIPGPDPVPSPPGPGPAPLPPPEPEPLPGPV